MEYQKAQQQKLKKIQEKDSILHRKSQQQLHQQQQQSQPLQQQQQQGTKSSKPSMKSFSHYPQNNNSKKQPKSNNNATLQRSHTAAAVGTLNNIDANSDGNEHKKSFVDLTIKKQQEQLFVEAYRFFSKNSASIEIVNEANELQEVHFGYLPHFNALNDDIIQNFSNLINRSNVGTKYTSLMEISNQFNQKLLSEQQFIDNANTSKWFSFIIFLSKKQPHLRAFNFTLSVIGNFNLILIYYPPKDYPEWSRERKLDRSPQALDDVFLQLTLWVQNIIVVVLFVFFIIQNKSYMNWLIQQEISKIEKSQIIDPNEQIPALVGLTQVRKKVSWFGRQKIMIRFWISNMSVAYFVILTPILLFANFYHELFATLLLLDYLFRFPETQNVFKAFWDPKWKLLMNIILYILIMYYFTILAYLYLAEDYFKGTCDNLLTCFSVTFDNAQKQRISKLYATLENYVNTEPSYLMDREDLWDFFFMLIVVSCVWTWTFTSLIIESYGTLRRAAAAKNNDMVNICLPCSFSRDRIQKLTANGFDHHIKQTHNQWNYLRYMASLWYKPQETFTGTERYIFENMKKKRIHWFPIEKSLKFQKSK